MLLLVGSIIMRSVIIRSVVWYSIVLVALLYYSVDVALNVALFCWVALAAVIVLAVSFEVAPLYWLMLLEVVLW